MKGFAPLSLVVLLAGLAAPPARAELKKLPRPEAPWLSAALALPAPDLPGETLVLLAALYEVPEAWAAADGSSALRTHLEAGRRFSARAHPGGIVVVAEGPADQARESLALLTRLLEPLRASPLALARAQGRVLRRRAQGELPQFSPELALWRGWFADRAPPWQLLVDDIELHRTSLATLQQAHEKVRSQTSRLLVLEGRLPAEDVLASWSQDGSGPRLFASPLSPAPGEAVAPLRVSQGPPFLLAGHPLPPGEGDPLTDAMLEEALSESFEGAGPIEVHIERRGPAALLVLRAPMPPEGAQAGLQALQKRLGAVAAQLTNRRQVRAWTERARSRLAHRRATVGALAREEAVRWLAGPTPTEVPAEAAAHWLFPEALRAVAVQPP